MWLLAVVHLTVWNTKHGIPNTANFPTKRSAVKCTFSSKFPVNFVTKNLSRCRQGHCDREKCQSTAVRSWRVAFVLCAGYNLGGTKRF